MHCNLPYCLYIQNKYPFHSSNMAMYWFSIIDGDGWNWTKDFSIQPNSAKELFTNKVSQTYGGLYFPFTPLSAFVSICQAPSPK